MPKRNQKNPNVSAAVPDRTLEQLNELITAGHFNTKTDALAAAINYMYYHKIESANAVTLASRKVAEAATTPEITEIDGKLWLNLGSGMLAEGAAAMLAAQCPGDVETRQNALDEWLIWHRSAADDAYAMMRAIVMFRFE